MLFHSLHALLVHAVRPREWYTFCCGITEPTIGRHFITCPRLQPLFIHAVHPSDKCTCCGITDPTIVRLLLQPAPIAFLIHHSAMYYFPILRLPPPPTTSRQRFLLNKSSTSTAASQEYSKNFPITYTHGVEHCPHPSIYRPDEIREFLVAVGVLRVLREADLDCVENGRLSRPVRPVDDVNAPGHTLSRSTRHSVSRGTHRDGGMVEA